MRTALQVGAYRPSTELRPEFLPQSTLVFDQAQAWRHAGVGEALARRAPDSTWLYNAPLNLSFRGHTKPEAIINDDGSLKPLPWDDSPFPCGRKAWWPMGRAEGRDGATLAPDAVAFRGPRIHAIGAGAPGGKGPLAGGALMSWSMGRGSVTGKHDVRRLTFQCA